MHLERISRSSYAGLSGKPIFNDTQDYQNFIERLDNILTDNSTPCYAWAQMTNHVHTIVA